MASREIAPERVEVLNARGPADGDYVLYWMQQSQRASSNHALEYAVRRANTCGLPLVVCFGLTDGFPEANLRHYRFMLEGLQETAKAITKRGAAFVFQKASPDDVALALGRRAAVIVCDRGYLWLQKQWRANVAEDAPCEVVQIESDVIVPVGVASNKVQYGARTIRPRIHEHLERFLVGLNKTPLNVRLMPSAARDFDSIDLRNLDGLLDSLNIDHSIGAVTRHFRGGYSQARTRLRRFLREDLAGYRDDRNQPQTPRVSHLSIYLHFGQISPLEIALEIDGMRDRPAEDRQSFLEELIVRRELAQNFVEYTEHYDTYECLPKWARATLKKHASDERPQTYTISQLENAETHDRYWNAAMLEMKHTGYMHNLLRMYWGKKILEWSASPEEAYRTTLTLNNRYFLDGRDANSFANVGWIFGLHDRPWPERPIYGTVRTMTASGLERKCDIDAYVRRVTRLARRRETRPVAHAH